MKLVIYARFSSHNQTEQSIEGQLKICNDFAMANGHTVVGTYIDRAQSGTTDSRAEFQKMIADSDKHTFDGVLVYQLDRFARNRYDSAINKAKLKKNGVRVISAKENISDDASGILVEGVLESMAEYYSAELSQKIHRGMELNAQKCLSTGSNPGLGFKVDSDRRFYVDEDAAEIVREIFNRYANGEKAADIVKDLNRRKLTTSLGREFNQNSIGRILRNKRYIGTYIYNGKETPDGMPRIIDDELFYRVQSMLDKNKAAPARSRSKEEYLLTTKLFCGYCKEMMIGYCGTGKYGDVYHYYICKKARKKLCDKKLIKKSYIENKVIKACLDELTESRINYIAQKVEEACKKDLNNAAVNRIKSAIGEIDSALENLWLSLEKGKAVDMITERINKRQEEKDELLKQLAIEENKCFTVSEMDVKIYLDYIKNLPDIDISKRRVLINIFVNSIYLYDDRMTIIFNASNKKLSQVDIPFDNIEEKFSKIKGKADECLSLTSYAPPKQKRLPKGDRFCFVNYSEWR